MIYYTTSINLTHEAAAREHCQRLRTESAKCGVRITLDRCRRIFRQQLGIKGGLLYRHNNQTFDVWVRKWGMRVYPRMALK